MRTTSGAWLHAQLSVLVAACWATGCGQTSVSDSDEGNAGSVGTTAGTGTAAGGASAHGGQVTQGGSVAEGGKVGQGGSSLGGAPGLLCNGSSPQLTAGWRTEPALDYVALRYISEIVTRPVEETGTPCSGASAKAACQSAFEALVPTSTWSRGGQLPIEEYFAYTSGDDLGTIGTLAELKAILGDIDTPNEAAVLLYVVDRPVQCDKLHTVPDGFVGQSRQNLSDCPMTYQPLEVHVAVDATVSETPVGEKVVTNLCAGRRPDGLSLLGAVDTEGAGACFAQMAELELASIAAFADLARQLTAHGAPPALVQRCHAARRDEIEHARVVAGLARSFGARPKLVRVASRGVRSLLELALENAREGCVRELYGAAAAAWQAEHAPDQAVRVAFARIARDEAEHAALALELDAWLATRLSSAECAQLAAEKTRAAVELQAELERTPDSRARDAAGLPSGASSLRLAKALRGFVSAA